MADIVDKHTRSKMMSAVKGKNTTPELIVRRYLHQKGFRFRLHRKDLPGKPDLVLPKYHLAIFVHGCFWHQHPYCRFAAIPTSHILFWRKKFEGNAKRDRTQVEALIEAGWRVLVIWECGLKHCSEHLDDIPSFIRSQESYMSWPDTPQRPI